MASQEMQLEVTTTSTRVAYIRTVLDKETAYYEWDWSNLECWLGFWVGQKVPEDPFGHEQRKRRQSLPDIHHHYVLGHSNATDAFVLEWLLKSSEPGGWRLSRADFTIHLSRPQINVPANKLLLHRLEGMGVGIEAVSPQSTEYASDDICDAVMLSKSDYVLDTSLVRVPSCSATFDILFRDSMRYGRPQQYNTEERSNAYYANRLKSKMGHTQRYCGYPHGKSEVWKHEHEQGWKNYKCPSCGKRCKRSKGCKTTGEWWAENKTPWADGVDTSSPRPPEFEKEWRNLSVQNVLNYPGPDAMALERFRNWKWRSVDTFSGE